GERPVPGRQIERGVLLRGVARPRTHDDAIGELARDRGGLVVGLRVHDDDLVGPRDRLETRAQPFFLVARDEGDREFRFFHTLASEGGTPAPRAPAARRTGAAGAALVSG